LFFSSRQILGSLTCSKSELMPENK